MLFRSPLHLPPRSSLCAQLNKQAGVASHYGNPWNESRTLPCYLGSPSGALSLSHTHTHSLSLSLSLSRCRALSLSLSAPSRPISLCVLLSQDRRDGFHSPLGTMRLAHQVDSIRIARRYFHNLTTQNRAGTLNKTLLVV